MGSTNSIANNNIERTIYDEINIKISIDDENELYFCIVKPINSNPYSSQALQIGSGWNCHVYRLETITENMNSLVYEFEEEYKLTFTKRGTDIILICKHGYMLYVPIKKMSVLTQKLFKPFEYNDNTIEFNKLYEFIAFVEDDNSVKTHISAPEYSIQSVNVKNLK